MEHLLLRLNHSWPGCNEVEVLGCATAWVNSICFSPGYPNKANNGTIVPTALIKKWARDRVRSRSWDGRQVTKGQQGLGWARESGNRIENRWEGGWGDVLLISLFLSHLHCVLLYFTIFPLWFHILLSSQLLSFSAPSPRPFILTSYPCCPTSHLLYSFHMFFVPLCFCVWDWQRMLCLSYHLCITSPIQRDSERDRERGGGQHSEEVPERHKKKRPRCFLA